MPTSPCKLDLYPLGSNYFTRGTILGIWPGSGLINRTGRELVCSMMVQYGPRVTIALALDAKVTKDHTMVP